MKMTQREVGVSLTYQVVSRGDATRDEYEQCYHFIPYVSLKVYNLLEFTV